MEPASLLRGRVEDYPMPESTVRAERFEPKATDSPVYVWEVPQKPVAVRMPFSLIDRLETEALESFRSLNSRGSEIGGVLLGSAVPGEPATVWIEDYEVVACDYSRGPLYRLSEADIDRFARVIAQRTAGGGQVVGFFRSHTRKGLALDPEDVSLFDTQFPSPHHVVLLIRPFASKPATAGIFVRENGTVHGEASYKEFTFRSSHLSPAPKTGADQAPAAGGPGVALPSPAAPKNTPRAQIVPIAPRREAGVGMPPIATDPMPAPAATAPPAAAPPLILSAAVPRVAPEPPASRPREEAPEKLPTIEKPAVAEKPVVAEKPAAVERPAAVEKPVAAERPVAPEKAVAAEKDAAAKAPAEAAAAKVAGNIKDNPAAAAPVVRAAPPAKEVPAAEEAPVAKPAAETRPQPASPMFGGDLETADEGRRSGKLLWIGAGAAVALIVLVALFLYPGLLMHHGAKPAVAGAPPQDSSPLGLRVQRIGGELLLSWNRDSDPIRNATGAVLSISDGEQHENVPLDVAQLRSGSIEYTPATGDVVFNMEVNGKGANKTLSDMVRSLQIRPSPMPQGAPAAQTAATPAKPAGTPAANTPAPAPAAAEPPPVEEAPAKSPERPLRPFRADSVPLAQRLRATPQSDLPDAPSLGGTGSAGSTGIAGLNMNPSAPPPPLPSAPANPAAAAPPAAVPKSGGNIQQAVLIRRTEPVYPKIARDAGAKGTVVLVATIGADGRVKTVKIQSGHPMLVKAAADAVMQWVYRPTTLNGTPVEGQVQVQVNFLSPR